jgi:hypothetical protein
VETNVDRAIRLLAEMQRTRCAQVHARAIFCLMALLFNEIQNSNTMMDAVTLYMAFLCLFCTGCFSLSWKDDN